MQIELLIMPAAMTLLTGVALSYTPVWVRPGTYFGVRVEPGYRSSAPARETRRRFTLAVWLATLAALALTVAAAGKPALTLAGVMVQIAGASVAFRGGWLRTRPHSVAAPSTRTAHLLAAPPRVPGGAAAIAGPFLLVAGVALYLRAHWSAIPALFPVHWDMAGHANGWRHRTAGGVFTPLLLAVGILVFMAIVMALIARSVPRSREDSGLYRRNRTVLGVLVGAMWTVAIECSLVALMPFFLGGQQSLPGGLLAAMILLPLGLAAGGVWAMARAASDPDDTDADHTPDECWKWGQIYYNPADPSLMVEKRFGLGYTLNFARWPNWVLMGSILVLPLVIVLLAHH